MKIATLFACVSSVAAFSPSAFVPKTSMGVQSSSSLNMALKDGESKLILVKSVLKNAIFIHEHICKFEE